MRSNAGEQGDCLDRRSSKGDMRVKTGLDDVEGRESKATCGMGARRDRGDGEVWLLPSCACRRRVSPSLLAQWRTGENAAPGVLDFSWAVWAGVLRVSARRDTVFPERIDGLARADWCKQMRGDQLATRDS